MFGFQQPGNLTDAELIELCNSASGPSARRAFDVLYARHKEFVLRVAMQYSGDHNIALDALQESFLYLLKQFPPTGSGLTLTAKLSTYLYPIAKNAAISQLRKRHSSAISTDIDPDDLPAAPETSDRDLHTVLKELPPTGREIVTLRFIHEFSIAEIARALDIPTGTAKSRLHNAVQHLRNSPKIKRFFEK